VINQRTRFSSIWHMALGVACVAILGACATSSPASLQYTGPPETEPAATLINQGAMGTTTTSCQLPGTSHVCLAWVSGVDNLRTDFSYRPSAAHFRVSPGLHTLALGCNTWSGGPAFFGGIKTTIKSFQGMLEASRTYYVRCEKHENDATIWLSDSATGAALAGFQPLVQ
jgi:hypothetical protein